MEPLQDLQTYLCCEFLLEVFHEWRYSTCRSSSSSHHLNTFLVWFHHLPPIFSLSSAFTLLSPTTVPSFPLLEWPLTSARSSAVMLQLSPTAERGRPSYWCRAGVNQFTSWLSQSLHCLLHEHSVKTQFADNDVTRNILLGKIPHQYCLDHLTIFHLHEYF